MSLTLIIGCMFSGKTTELLRMVEREESIGRNVVIINHQHDASRSGDGVVKTHNHRGDIARKADYQTAILTEDILEKSISDSVDTIAINEGQFFDGLGLFVTTCLEKNIDVIVCGLDSDYLRKPFANIISLVPEADTLIKTTALCSICKDGTPAIFSMRTHGGDSRVQIGGKESYKPVCRKCFKE